MKKIAILFSAILILVSSFTLVTHLYTKEKVESLGSNLGSMSSYGFMESFSLGELLAFNLGVYAEDHLTYDEQTNQYKNGWRDLIASNPSLAYSAFDMYSSDFVRGFKEALESEKNLLIQYHVENPIEGSTEEIERLKSINANTILSSSVSNMKNYQRLIDELLKLDDAKLNSLIKSIGKDPSCFYSETEEAVPATELLNWLSSKGFVTKSEDDLLFFPYLSSFPTDLILLSHRISSNYPAWTNRKFLQEAKKFSQHVEKNLKF